MSKTVKDIMIDIQDDDYWYLTAFESLDEEKRNDILSRMYSAAARKDAGLALDNCRSLRNEIDNQVERDAQEILERPRGVFESMDSDVDSLNRLSIRDRSYIAMHEAGHKEKDFV